MEATGRSFLLPGKFRLFKVFASCGTKGPAARMKAPSWTCFFDTRGICVVLTVGGTTAQTNNREESGEGHNN